MGGFNFNFNTPGNDIMKATNFGGGQNQYMNFPSLAQPTATSQPTTQPSQPFPGSPPYSGYPYFGGGGSLTPIAGSVGAADKLPGGAGTTPTLDPRFTQMLDSWLGSQIGSGISPFNLQSYLPSSGGFSGSGQVAAPLTQLLQQLQSGLSGGNPNGTAGLASMLGIANTGGLGSDTILGHLAQTGGLTGPLADLAQTGGLTGTLGNLFQTGGLTGTLGQMAQTGQPTNVLPEWQSMIDAQQTNIAQNQANLKEQFASMGNLSSSPAANAMALYNAQTSADQNSLLGQLNAQSLENAQGRALQAGEFGSGLQSTLGQFGTGLEAQLGQMGVGTQLSAAQTGLGAQAGAAGNLLGLGANLGQQLQGLDQQSIQNLMQEYFMTTPQNNPLNNMFFGMGTTFAPTYTRQGGVGSGLVGSLGSILSGAGSAAGGLAQLAPFLAL